MAEYVSKKQVIEWFRPYEHTDEGIPYFGLLTDIHEMKSADVVEVVRCRECKHHYWGQEPCHGKIVHYCELPHMRGVEVFKEFFCYYGERGEREEGDE